MIEGINTENWPVWLIVSLFLLLMVYRDIIKPYFERKIQSKLELEKKNIEIKRYNEDAERWNKLLKYIEKNVINVISSDQAQVIINEVLQNAARELILRVYDFIDKNEIKNPNRQKIISSHIVVFLRNQKDRIIRIISAFECNNQSVANYFEQISAEHTTRFIQDIQNVLFSEIDSYRKKDDIGLLISSHYNQHINEAIDYLN